jgi:hypothetical protein
MELIYGQPIGGFIVFTDGDALPHAGRFGSVLSPPMPTTSRMPVMQMTPLVARLGTFARNLRDQPWTFVVAVWLLVATGVWGRSAAAIVFC